MTQPQHATIEIQHGAVVGVLDVHGEILEPRGLREVWFGVTDGRGEPERAGMDVPLVGRVRLGHVGRDPGQRHAAAVTTLLRLVAHTVERGRVLELIPRNVGHFGESEFLALIHVCGSGQRKLHQDGGASATRTLLPILGVTRAVT